LFARRKGANDPDMDSSETGQAGGRLHCYRNAMRASGTWLAPLLFLFSSGYACSGGDDAAPAGAGGSRASGGSGGDGSGGAVGGAGGTSEPPRWEVETVTTWRGNAEAAYTMFYDDTCNGGVDNQFDIADVELTARGLRASFGAIAQDCATRNLTDRLLTLLSHGHEIVNHSWSHPNLSLSPVDIALQIDGARTALETQLGGREVTFFIFPFDAFTDDLVDHLRAQGYLGARAGMRGWNPSAFEDDFRVAFDVFGPGYSIYAEAPGTPCASVLLGTDWNDSSPECRRYVLDQYVRDVLAEGGWGVRELHSIAGEAWEPVPEDEYLAHLDFVTDFVEDGRLWVAPASDVIRYRRAQAVCPLPTVSGDRLVFPPTARQGACLRFATGLSYVLRPLEGTPQGVTARQDDAVLDVLETGDGRLIVTADPSAGAVELLEP
jgi:peptidoglycan/xylan/chitin deacetylase (PgdA/CDA1 family)